eukprot:c35647_g1_i1 orf=2-157(-)
MYLFIQLTGTSFETSFHDPLLLQEWKRDCVGYKTKHQRSREIVKQEIEGNTR